MTTQTHKQPAHEAATQAPLVPLVPLALDGIKVLDISQGIAGPHSAMLLAQNGASVIKVEPVEGDWGRTLGKTYGDHCAQSMTFNRGKRSIALDLKKPAAAAIVRDLAAQADIVIESFRPGVMQRFGLDYDSVRVGNPGVIYLSVTGFGQDGPYSSFPVTDSIIQAFSGWMTLHQDENGTPMRSGITAIDVLTGLYAYQAISTAYIARLRHGGGRYIDCSMLQSAAAFQTAKVLENFFEDGRPEVSYVPVGVFATADGFISISAMRDKHFAGLCNELGVAALATDPRFDTRDQRRANKETLMPLLAAAFRKQNTAHWEKVLTAADIMNARVNTYIDMLGDEHVREAGTFSYIAHPGMRTAPVARIPGVPPPRDDEARALTPHVGEHSDAILGEMGLDAARREALFAEGAVSRHA